MTDTNAPPLLRRINISLAVGLLALVAAFLYQVYVPGAGNDLWLPLCSTKALLRGLDPYGPDTCIIIYNGQVAAKYPLTTLIAMIPFARPAGVLWFWAVSSAVLAFGLLRSGKWWHLLLFASPAYWYAFRWLQFSPLITALALLPALLPLSLIKPQLGFPIGLLYLTDWKRHKWPIVTTVLFGLSTLVIDPSWPLRWYEQSKYYDGFVPLLWFPLGFLVVGALWKWRDKRAWLLVLMAAIPQRGLYDVTVLWLLPRTLRQMVALSLIGWVGFWLEYAGILSAQSALVLFAYLPAAGMVLWGGAGQSPLESVD